MPVPFTLDSIRIGAVNLFYDANTETKVREAYNLVQYESRHFRCRVSLSIDESYSDSNWSIGLVQACDKMLLENRYGSHGSSFWEFHPLKSNRSAMVNDSDGRQYPFYSLTNSKIELKKGDIKAQKTIVEYEDHFYPTVAWELPFMNNARLTDVIREQDFYIWLVAIKRKYDGTRHNGSFDQYDFHHDTVYILKTMRWQYNLHLKFDPSKPIGSRLIQIDDQQKKMPFVYDNARKIPSSALAAPHCNAAQSLIWYPNDRTKSPKVLVPPKLIITEWNVWCKEMMSIAQFNFSRPRDCKSVAAYPKDSENGFIVEGTKSGYKRSWTK